MLSKRSLLMLITIVLFVDLISQIVWASTINASNVFIVFQWISWTNTIAIAVIGILIVLLTLKSK